MKRSKVLSVIMSWYEDIVSNTDHSSLANYDGVYNTLADKF